MRILEVSYDLNGRDETFRDYVLLINEIRKLGTVAKGLKSSWFVRTSLSVNEVFNKLIPFVDGNDGLQVIDVKDMQCNRNLPPDAIQLIDQTLYQPKHLPTKDELTRRLDFLISQKSKLAQTKVNIPKMNRPF